MRANRVVQAVFLEGVVAQPRPGGVTGPIVLQPLGAEDQNALVAHFEEFDDRQRRPCLSEADAVGDDAPVVPQKAVDRARRAVLLERIERFPYLRIVEMDVVEQAVALALFRQPAFEDMEERLVIYEFGRIRPAQAGQRLEDIAFRVAGQISVLPETVEPGEERRAVVAASDLKIELDIGRGAEPQPASRKVGTAGQRRRPVLPRDMVELAVQEIGAVDGPDLDLIAYPACTFAGQRLLPQRLLQRHAAILGQAERHRLVPLRVHRADARRVAIEEADRPRAVQGVAQGFVTVDGEIGRDDRQRRLRPDTLA